LRGFSETPRPYGRGITEDNKKPEDHLRVGNNLNILPGKPPGLRRESSPIWTITIGSGILYSTLLRLYPLSRVEKLPDLPQRKMLELAGLTAGQDFHLALKISRVILA
jgi:hypothetical protein